MVFAEPVYSALTRPPSWPDLIPVSGPVCSDRFLPDLQYRLFCTRPSPHQVFVSVPGAAPLIPSLFCRSVSCSSRHSPYFHQPVLTIFRQTQGPHHLAGTFQSQFVVHIILSAPSQDVIPIALIRPYTSSGLFLVPIGVPNA